MDDKKLKKIDAFDYSVIRLFKNLQVVQYSLHFILTDLRVDRAARCAGVCINKRILMGFVTQGLVVEAYVVGFFYLSKTWISPKTEFWKIITIFCPKNTLPRFSIFTNLCRSAGFFLQGSAKIVALNPEDPYRSARSLQKCADFL